MKKDQTRLWKDMGLSPVEEARCFLLLHAGGILNYFFNFFNIYIINFKIFVTVKRRSSRLNTQGISEFENKECYICHGFEDAVGEELLHCSNCTSVGKQISLSCRLTSFFWPVTQALLPNIWLHV